MRSYVASVIHGTFDKSFDMQTENSWYVRHVRIYKHNYSLPS